MIKILIIFFLCSGISLGLFFYFLKTKKIQILKLKGMLYHSLIITGLFIIISGLSLIRTENLKIIYILVAFSFLCIGILHVWLLYKEGLFQRENIIIPEILFTGILFFIGGMFFISISYFITLQWILPKSYTTLYSTAIVPFSIPFFLYYTITFWKDIPKLLPEGWQYDEFYKPPEVIDSPDEKWINCIFRVGNIDYNISIPVKYKIGDAFHLLIEENIHSDAIKVKRIDDNGNQTNIKWYFITQEIIDKSSRYVDPELTFGGNYIKEGDIIWVRDNP